jgi:hypothetical protein
MATAVKKQTSDAAANTQKKSEAPQEEKKLSKLGEWMRDNPGGIFVIKDRRAINKMRY